MKCAICWDEDIVDTCKRLDHATATRNRAALRGRPWSMLVIHTESGGRRAVDSDMALLYGDRHYLDGRPIHCGDFIELQRISCAEDDFGQFTTYLDEGAVVRYEVEHRLRRGTNITERVPVMYAGVAGRSFTATIDAGCYFRWPRGD